MEFYQSSQKEVLESLNSRIDGLTDSEVDIKQSALGKNIVSVHRHVSFLKLLASQFKSYLTWLLIVVTAVAFFSGFYMHRSDQILNGIIISIIIVVNVFVGTYQDYKSERAAELLKSMLKSQTIVVRNGCKQTLDSSEIVPGDIIVLGEGDKVPADARIIECQNLYVDESMLTGESKPASKSYVAIVGDVPVAERKDMLYMNTYVVRGAATCVVTATGLSTEVGKIAKSLEIEQDAPFTEELDYASKRITFVALVLILLVSIIFFLKVHEWVSVFMIASALIIGSIPEGLPAIVTFTLALGSLRLAKTNVLIKRKALLETMGSVDVICTDKTGTLTENKMVVKKSFFDMQSMDDIGLSRSKTLLYFKSAALLANEAKNTNRGYVGDAEDIALIDMFRQLGDNIVDLRQRCPSKSFEPFSSETQYCSSINIVGKKIIEYRKGAPEVILKGCNSIMYNGTVKLITRKDKQVIESFLKEYSDQALRNIAFSYREVGKKGYTFVGIVGIYDKPKDEVKSVITVIYEAGIELKMITGDNINTAVAIAKECGFRNVSAIGWDDLKDLTDDQLKETVSRYNVFARMSPQFKLRIVKALQAGGHRVAITGDGVNDVPALKQAEVGVAMGKRGSDIAKEAGDIVLLDDNLSSLAAGIKEGRTIFSNVRKIINYLLTANLAEIAVVFVGSLFGVMPFLAIQLLWVNFVTDIAPAIALGLDPSHKNIMKKSPTGKKEKIINSRITWLTILIGIKKVAIMLFAFYVVYKLSGNLALAQTVAFTWLVFSHFVRIAAIRFDEGMALFVNKYVNWAMAVPVVLQLIIIYTPASRFFQVVPLMINEWFIIIITIVMDIFLARVITWMLDARVPLTGSDY